VVRGRRCRPDRENPGRTLMSGLVGTVTASRMTAAATFLKVPRSQNRESRRGIDIGHRPPTERSRVRVEYFSIGGVGRRKPVPMRSGQWTIGYGFTTHVSRFAEPCHRRAQTVSAPA
jgi:hypothetical protein